MSICSCRVCGCTDTRACEGGCWWAEPDLCSTCARKLAARERPMLFSGPMVRALLDGSKTQTRRTLKRCGWWESTGDGMRPIPEACPHGRRGDRVWVRESFRFPASLDPLSPLAVGAKALDAGYRMPWAPTQFEADQARTGEWRGFDTPPVETIPGKLRPGIHMPRWACRLVLEIIDVRVQHLQEISEEDARAEGVEPNWCGPLDKGPNGTGTEGWLGDSWIHYGQSVDGDPAYSARESFESLWDSINGAGAWQANPWVWAITFRRLEASHG